MLLLLCKEKELLFEYWASYVQISFHKFNLKLNGPLNDFKYTKPGVLVIGLQIESTGIHEVLASHQAHDGTSSHLLQNNTKRKCDA